MVAMRYTVTAERGHDPRVWVLQCEQVPGAISETRRLGEAPELMREAIAFVAQVDEADVEVDIRPVLPADVEQQVSEAQGAIRDLAAVQIDTAKRSRQAVAALIASGLSGADTAAVLGISPQRVSQLRADIAPREGSRAS